MPQNLIILPLAVAGKRKKFYNGGEEPLGKSIQRHQREYKDRLFKKIFSDRRDLLDLYNALNGTSYDNPDDIVVNTLEDVIYLGMKNDISFILKNILSLYEHQSTLSPNLALRGCYILHR